MIEEDIPELDENGIPVDAEPRDISDEEWFELMASVPVEPGSDAEQIGAPESYGEDNEDWFGQDEVGRAMSDVYDDQPDQDVDLPYDAELEEIDDADDEA